MPNSEIDAETAYGETIAVSFLLPILFKRMVQKGIFSDAEIVDITDQALLSLETAQGDQHLPSKAIARARAILEATLLSFAEPHEPPQGR